jgi:hypothetical protein
VGVFSVHALHALLFRPVDDDPPGIDVSQAIGMDYGGDVASISSTANGVVLSGT